LSSWRPVAVEGRRIPVARTPRECGNLDTDGRRWFLHTESSVETHHDNHESESRQQRAEPDEQAPPSLPGGAPPREERADFLQPHVVHGLDRIL